MFLKPPTNYFNHAGELLPFDDAPPDGPSPKTPPEKWSTEFSSFESIFTVPISFVASRTQTRPEGLLLCEISRLGAKLDMIIKLYVQEVQRTQLFDHSFSIFQNAPPDVLPIVPLIMSGLTDSMKHVAELYQQFGSAIAQLRRSREGLVTWVVANRGFSKDPDSGKSAAEKRRQLADAEELLLQRIDQLLHSGEKKDLAFVDVYRHTSLSWPQIIQQITGSAEPLITASADKESKVDTNKQEAKKIQSTDDNKMNNNSNSSHIKSSKPKTSAPSSLANVKKQFTVPEQPSPSSTSLLNNKPPSSSPPISSETVSPVLESTTSIVSRKRPLPSPPEKDTSLNDSPFKLQPPNLARKTNTGHDEEYQQTYMTSKSQQADGDENAENGSENGCEKHDDNLMDDESAQKPQKSDEVEDGGGNTEKPVEEENINNDENVLVESDN